MSLDVLHDFTTYNEISLLPLLIKQNRKKSGINIDTFNAISTIGNLNDLSIDKSVDINRGCSNPN